jgi:hypothetical protein
MRCISSSIESFDQREKNVSNGGKAQQNTADMIASSTIWPFREGLPLRRENKASKVFDAQVQGIHDLGHESDFLDFPGGVAGPHSLHQFFRHRAEVGSDQFAHEGDGKPRLAIKMSGIHSLDVREFLLGNTFDDGPLMVCPTAIS